ncbi:MAG TPA: bifunctional riboflavin kinase/FAD synthetase [Acidimicrobiaceae bacterium]|nr:bifunctional riboflavin kinase/FMN adenylyltransferase [Acidimicrobiaceae bacterium]MCH2632528.1 bifunctional riboflavin kinase/FAD synthetase [Acidimicrobiales bacterium]HAY66232.1 bifunctional riboflavin kinase/FAD synthetase [Acidimicrobiaceae bacterium]HBV24730.1 bifunctional riboflavin kinase/FAD synthetase [Acidimicrobiaceae bacterium]HCK73343.1 bifunctional riboflavin kinase/FAD synthetase [Acidimicrobiaceae bacterium]
MEIIRDPAWSPALEQGSVVTVGEYDGVHRGHRTVISEMHRMAAERGCATAVVTFDRHPATIVRPESAPLLLCDLDHKLELLAETGVDYTLVVEFTPEQAEVPAEMFARQVLVDCLQARAVVVGADFHFGQGRRGNVETLGAVGEEFGYEVVGLPLVKQLTGEGEVISSTSIRAALSEGDVEKAHRLLGRPFEVRGVVTPGDRRGRTIGFPTANIPTTPDLQVPADGVYAAWYVRDDGAQYPAAVNIGKRPTFYDDAERSLIEAHLIGFRGDLYGESAKVRFVRRLRGEKKFDGIDSLKQQLVKDVADAAKCLAE